MNTFLNAYTLTYVHMYTHIQYIHIQIHVYKNLSKTFVLSAAFVWSRVHVWRLNVHLLRNNNQRETI